MDPLDRIFDKRIIRRNLDSEQVTPEQYQKYLKELSDRVDEAEPIEVSLNETDEPEAEQEESNSDDPGLAPTGEDA